jgi:hypothetical protein
MVTAFQSVYLRYMVEQAVHGKGRRLSTTFLTGNAGTMLLALLGKAVHAKSPKASRETR